jgi:hypothetical protein
MVCGHTRSSFFEFAAQIAKIWFLNTSFEVLEKALF